MSTVTSGGRGAAAARVMHEVLTPRWRATSAPEYPSSRIASQASAPRAATTGRRRLPARSSPADTPHTSHACRQSVSMFRSRSADVRALLQTLIG